MHTHSDSPVPIAIYRWFTDRYVSIVVPQRPYCNTFAQSGGGYSYAAEIKNKKFDPTVGFLLSELVGSALTLIHCDSRTSHFPANPSLYPFLAYVGLVFLQ